MDLVRVSAASGFAFMAMLTAAASASGGSAGSSVDAAYDLPAERIQARIDEAFRTAEPGAAFALTGPLFPVTPDMPVRSHDASAERRWPLTSSSVDAWSAYIAEASHRFGVPADWVRGVMQQESGGRTHLGGRPITSSAGAMGLMQVMPATFAEMSALHGLGNDPYDPRANILAGTAYLRAMYDRFGPAHFLAAYNAGPARVEAHLRTGRALPGETRAYTAALLPRLFPERPAAATDASMHVQDLTGTSAMRTLVSSSSRSSPVRAGDMTAAPVFAAVAAMDRQPAEQRVRQPTDSLFVPLTAVDRRQQASADRTNGH